MSVAVLCVCEDSLFSGEQREVLTDPVEQLRQEDGWVQLPVQMELLVSAEVHLTTTLFII